MPGASVGATPEILQSAEKIIIEVNTKIPSFEGAINRTITTTTLMLIPFTQVFTTSTSLSSRPTANPTSVPLVRLHHAQKLI